MVNFNLFSKVSKFGIDRFHAYIESIASGDGSAYGRMSSGPGSVGPFDHITPELKQLSKTIISELPEGWTRQTIIDAVQRKIGVPMSNDDE